MKNIIKELRRKDHPHVLGALDIFKYIGPGLLVTVGFIDPGIWLHFALGGDTINDYAHCPSTQCGPSWHCNRPVFK